MTAAAAPPLTVPVVDVAELPALDQPDERACEMRMRFGPIVVECNRPAAWVMSGTCATCQQTRTRLACEECKCGMTENGPGRVGCIDCDADVTITWMERIR